MLKRFAFALFAFLLVPLCLRSGDVSSKSIAGSSATVQLSTTSTPVKWIQMVAPSGNAATVYWGDCATANSTNGGILPAGAGQMLPTKEQGGYDLSQVCVYVTTGDTLKVGWERQ